MSVVIQPEAPSDPEVMKLLAAHLEFSRATSPPGHVHALDLEGLSEDVVRFFGARENGKLLGIGALRDLGGGRAEIKSMHTTSAARGRGVGRSMLEHLVTAASDRGVTWVGLETGSMDEFAAARSLYRSAGFSECEPFEQYSRNPFSTCMSMTLGGNQQ